MKIHTVWIQRKQRYEGQWLPELVAAFDDNEHSEYPNHVHGEVEKSEMQGDVESVAYIVLDLADLTWEKIQDILNRPVTLKSDVKAYLPA